MNTSKSNEEVVLVVGQNQWVTEQLQRDLSPHYRVLGLRQITSLDPGNYPEVVEHPEHDGRPHRLELSDVNGNGIRRLTSVIHLGVCPELRGAKLLCCKASIAQEARHLAKLLKELGVEIEQFIFLSSLTVLAPAMSFEDRLTEDSNPQSQREDSKVLLEAEELLAQELDDIPVVILRLAMLYDHDGHSPMLARHMRRIYEMDTQSFLFPGNAAHGIAHLHLKDLSHCVLNAVQRRHLLNDREMFLVGEPVTLAYRDLLERLGELIHGETWPVISIPKSVAKAGAWLRRKFGGDVEVELSAIDRADDHYPMSMHAAHERLAWAPRHRLDDCLPAIVHRLQNNPRSWYEDHGFSWSGTTEAERANR